MAEETQSGNGALWFIVGALVVAVIGFGAWYFAGQPASGSGSGSDESGGGSDVSVSVSEDGVSAETSSDDE